MERSTIHLLSTRGRSIRQIAAELGRSPTTISRALQEPVERQPATRYRRAQVDSYRPRIAGWLRDGLTAERMLELARADPARPYPGGQRVFRGYVRRVRLEHQQHHAASAVPIRFAGLPAEYLPVDWGEIRQVPFARQVPATRYFLACRLKHSRWTWVRFTTDLRQEPLCWLEMRPCPSRHAPVVMMQTAEDRQRAHRPLAVARRVGRGLGRRLGAALMRPRPVAHLAA